MVLETFTKRLRAYRKLKHLTQHELAYTLGVSVAIVGGWERGTREPTEVEVGRIMEILQVNKEELGLTGQR